MSDSTAPVSVFSDLNLPPSLLKMLDTLGYETPSPIQAEAIPSLLDGRDLLGHAPTGTGKTAAFALPLLARIDLRARPVQVLTLTPTRELAIQVAEAYQRYATNLPGFHVLPIYGGQEYGGQIRALKRGVHVVVGTPGRIVDHMKKGTLRLDGLQAMVLDEADEMLRMGFIDEVEWILQQTPQKRQMALFSATMPKEIERIARRHLNDPVEISIKARTATAETIRQRYWLVSGVHKLDALTRILEVEQQDAVLIFVRTKTATTQLAERLAARGYAVAAMNGDMAQSQREQMVARLKSGSLDILVATDVAARGLDVERISHVINYDIPYDTEAYIHRIGRTGRAGREGDAILFVSPRERRMLTAIERATRQKIEQLELPTTEVVNNERIAKFKQKISDALATDELAFMRGVVEQYQQEHDVPAVEIAAALAQMSIGDQPLLMKPEEGRTSRPREGAEPGSRGGRKRREHGINPELERFRIEVGLMHDVRPGNIVGAFANEAGLDGRQIGRVDIKEDHSFVELPIGMPQDVFKDLKKVWVCGQQLNISRVNASDPGSKQTNKATDKRPDKRPDKRGDKRSNKRSDKRDDARGDKRPEKRQKPAATGARKGKNKGDAKGKGGKRKQKQTQA